MNILTEDNSDNKDYLPFDEMVGEGKRYKDKEAFSKAKQEGDSYIEFMKRRMDEMRKDYLELREESMAKANFEQEVDRVLKARAAGENKKPDEAVKLDPIEIEKLVDKKFTEREQTQRQQANSKLVKDRLIERFGTGYQNTVKQKIAELDISEESFNTMAENYPQMLFKVLEVDQPRKTEGFQAPPRSAVGFKPTTEPERTWTWYQELKKSDPKAYRDPKTTQQMYDDYKKLGPRFEDGDFKAYGQQGIEEL